MIPINPLEHQQVFKTLYSECVGEVCAKYQLTRMELDILLFFANNPAFDTATHIVEIRRLAKSQVSSSIKLLEQRGYLTKEYTNCNRKTAHLKICSAAADIIRDGQAAQENFFSILMNGFSQKEFDTLKQYHERIHDNIISYLKENSTEKR